MASRLELLSNDHCVHRIGLHLIWCTKYRHPVLSSGIDDVVRQTVHQICESKKWMIRDIEIMPDHVHLFIQIPPTISSEIVVKTLKSASAISVFHAHPNLKRQKFWGSGLWSRGAYYGSVGEVSQETVIQYIDSQKMRSNSK